MADAAPLLEPVRWTERIRPPSERTSPRFWRGVTYALAALAAAAAITAGTAWQLTSQTTAERLLARVAHPLFEVERSVAAALPALPDQPADAPLAGYPIAVPIPAELRDAGADAVAAHVLAETAARLYAEGLESIAREEQAQFGLISDNGLFSATIGQLSAGGHVVATVGLGAMMTLWGLPVLLSLGFSGWRVLFDALTASCLAGGALILAIALAWRGWAAGRAEGAIDAYTRAVWEVAAEAADLLLMNAAIVAGAGAVLLAGRLAFAWFIRRAAAA